MRFFPLLFALVLVSGCTAPGDPSAPAGQVQDDNQTQVANETVLSNSGGWYCGSLNVNASIVASRPEVLAQAAKDAGFSFLGLIMDLGNSPDSGRQIQACNSLKESGILCIPCQEAGEEGRFVAVGVHAPIDLNQSLERMLSQARDEDAFVFLTRPMSMNNQSSWKRWDITEWDGLAVVSPMAQRYADNLRAVDKWHSFLNNGHRKYAIGETNVKAFTTIFSLRDMIDSSYQCLWLESLTEDSVKQALSAGRFYVTNGPEMNFSVNNASYGEELEVSYGDEVTITLDVTSNSIFNTVRIVRDGEVIMEIGKSFIKYNTTITSTILGDTWFSAEIWGSDFTPSYHDNVHAISNPIWVRVSTPS